MIDAQNNIDGWGSLEAWDNANKLRANNFHGGYVEAGVILFGNGYRYNKADGLLAGLNGRALELVARYNYTGLNDLTDGEYFFPAGDGFAVYPGPHGEPWETLHMKAFTMALQDRRAMDLAEQLAGRDAVMAVLEREGEVTFSKYPHSAEWLEGLRAAVNRLIEENL